MRFRGFIHHKEITVEKLWIIFHRATQPEVEVGSAQYDETRKSFYAGFNECFGLFKNVVSELGFVEGPEMIDQIQTQLTEFITKEIEKSISKAASSERRV